MAVIDTAPGRAHRIPRAVTIVASLGLAWAAAVAAQPAGGSALERGRILYEQHCTTCHGIDGKADTPVARMLVPRPRNFSDPIDMARVTIERMYRAIKDGRPGTAMAGWEEILSEPEIGDLIDYVRSLTPVRDARSLSGDQLSQEIGARIYKRDCASCHGLNGRADTDMARALTPPPQNFVDPLLMARLDNGRMFAAISRGRPGTAMGGWRDLLSPQEIVDLMRYVRTLQQPLPRGMDGNQLDLRVGQQVFERYCVLCHGPDGDGHTPLGQQLVPHPRDFTQAVVMNAKTDQQLAQAISHGVAGSAMAPWDGVLSREDIRRVIAYIRQTFGKR
jgi:cbb3-type cytochrome c oxidase subunit III